MSFLTPILWILFGAMVLGVLVWWLMRLVSLSMRPGEVWALKGQYRDSAPSPYRQDVEIIERRGYWVKYQGRENGYVWSSPFEAFTAQYYHTKKEK